MRTLPLSALALLLLAAPASAQEDACSQSDPCPWVLEVDQDGIIGEGLTATVGDWYVLDVVSFDDREHTLTLEGHDVQVTLAPGGSATSDPFQLGTPGTFSLEDQPTGDFVWVEVRETDVVGDEAGADEPAGGGDEKNTPLPLAAGLAALLGAVLLRRR